MSQNSPQEDASSLLQFPVDFPIKVFGLASERFAGEMESIAREHCGDFDSTRTSVSYSSRSRKYMCVTLVVRALSREHLDGIYRSLCRHPLVKTVF